MPEGTRRFRAYAEDPAGNVGDHRWTVIIDRSAPTAPAEVAFTVPDEGSAQLVWQPSNDPTLPDGTPGSGVAEYRLRHRVGDGAWSAWVSYGADERVGPELYDHPAGTVVAFQATAVDAVGNVSEPASTSGTVPGEPPIVRAAGPLADAEDAYLVMDTLGRSPDGTPLGDGRRHTGGLWRTSDD